MAKQKAEDLSRKAKKAKLKADEALKKLAQEEEKLKGKQEKPKEDLNSSDDDQPTPKRRCNKSVSVQTDILSCSTCESAKNDTRKLTKE